MASRVWEKLEAFGARKAEAILQAERELALSLEVEDDSVYQQLALPTHLNLPSSHHHVTPVTTKTNAHLEAVARRAEQERESRRQVKEKAEQQAAAALQQLQQREPQDDPKETKLVTTTSAANSGKESSLTSCLARLAQRDARAKEVQQLDKTNKTIKSVKLHLSMLTNTRRDIRFRIDGTPSELGPRGVLDFVALKAPKQLESCMQVVADRIIQCASANLAVDALMRGEVNYALAYMAVILCHQRPPFVDALLGALEAACPFIQPGLKDHWEREAKAKNWSREVRKQKLGYKDESEGDDEYIFRMQTLVGFYAAMLQVSPKLLDSYLTLVGSAPVHASSVNPLGGLPEAWRWLAKTTNGNKWRWVRFLLHAFLCVGGRDISLALPQQMRKLLKVMDSKEFKAECEKSASHPGDDDRIKSFEKFISENLVAMDREGAMKPPGRFDEVDGERIFVDPRNLPEGAIVNTG